MNLKPYSKNYYIGVLLALSAFLFVGIFLYSAENDRLQREKDYYRTKWIDERTAHGATKGEVARLKDDYKYLLKHK